MISLKKHIEARPEESLKAMCESYRSSLSVMGISATEVCPHLGEQVRQELQNLRDQLSPEAAPESVLETGNHVGEELKKWGENASAYFQKTAHDVKEIMLIVAETAQAVGERDHRYAREFVEFAGQLAAIGISKLLQGCNRGRIVARFAPRSETSRRVPSPAEGSA